MSKDGDSVAVVAQGRPSLLQKFGAKYGVEPTKMLDTLKATAFRGAATNEQMVALVIVADQYGLNPFTKEIYAFPDKNNGIVPVVGVDGWARIINSHPEFDGMDFEQDDESCTCTMYRKDRSHPIRVTEYKSECSRNTAPWGSHPKRMLRHKAMIQCARVAFGYVGIYDEDEAERIAEADVIAVSPPRAPVPMPTPRVKPATKPKAEEPQPEPPAADVPKKTAREIVTEAAAGPVGPFKRALAKADLTPDNWQEANDELLAKVADALTASER